MKTQHFKVIQGSYCEYLKHFTQRFTFRKVHVLLFEVEMQVIFTIRILKKNSNASLLCLKSLGQKNLSLKRNFSLSK